MQQLCLLSLCNWPLEVCFTALIKQLSLTTLRLNVIRAQTGKNRYTVSKGSRGGIVLAEKDQISAFSREIIDFQRKNHLTDTEMALNSHVSVEHIHNIKSMREMPDSSVVATLTFSLENKQSGKFGGHLHGPMQTH